MRSQQLIELGKKYSWQIRRPEGRTGPTMFENYKETRVANAWRVKEKSKK